MANTFTEVFQDGAHLKVRPHAHFPKDIWGDRFDNFTIEDKLMMERYAKDVEPLKEEVLILLMENSCDLAKKMSIIDVVERLGFSYYYEKEINELLHQIFKIFTEDNFIKDYDLYDTALQFRIFRQHGYKMPCDVFNKFTDGDGKFKETLKSDVRNMMSLYEAAHLRVHGEDILEQALGFTIDFLKTIATYSEQARLALYNSLNRGCQRVQARHFIRWYAEDESHNEKLLQLAKLEFNRLQLLHRQELSQFQKWWKSFDFARKLPYVKQRSVEAHFSTIVTYYEPQYSWARVLLSKIYMYMTIKDDTYDAYGTFEELQTLTDAFERWDLNLMEQFSEDYMKVVYKFVVNTGNKFIEEMTKIGKPYAAHFFKEQVLQAVRNYYNEARWVELKHMPTFNEYMMTTSITVGVRLCVTGALMGMEEVVEEKPYAQLMQAHKVIQACEYIVRLRDDIVSHEAELARGCRLASSVQCYMKDYEKSKQEVLQIFKKLIEDAWKDLVQERLLINSISDDCDRFSKPVVDCIHNYARLFEFMFQVVDGYTLPDDTIKQSIIETYDLPFSI